MTIKWAELAIVALATVLSAGTLVLLYSLGVRFSAVAADRPQSGGFLRFAARLCFLLCGAAVVFGVYLIVPYFGG